MSNDFPLLNNGTRVHLDIREMMVQHLIQKYDITNSYSLNFKIKSGHYNYKMGQMIKDSLGVKIKEIQGSDYNLFFALSNDVVISIYNSEEINNRRNHLDSDVYCVLVGEPELVYDVYHKINDIDFTVFGGEPSITWVTLAKNGFIDKKLKVAPNHNMKDCLFPNLGKSIKDFIQEYDDSSSSILMLLGPPGMGKTSFIINYLYKFSKHAIVSYDNDLLEKDTFFLHYLDADDDVLLLEDYDQFLKKRTQNSEDKIIHKFLNLSQGVISVGNKKMIFTANLEKEMIDPALIRPGRCFNVLEFPPYTRKQALTIAEEYDIKLDTSLLNQTGGITLAEIFSNKKKIEQGYKVGF